MCAALGGGSCVRCDAAGTICGAVCAHLTSDDDHCGRCDRACGGQGCVAGRCLPETVAAQLPRVAAIAVADDGLVFWTADSKFDGVWLGRHVPGEPACDDISPRCSMPIATATTGTLAIGDVYDVAVSAHYAYVAGIDATYRVARDASGLFETALVDAPPPLRPMYAVGQRLVWAARALGFVGTAFEGGPAHAVMRSPNLPAPLVYSLAILGDDVLVSHAGRVDSGGIFRGNLDASCFDVACTQVLPASPGTYRAIAATADWLVAEEVDIVVPVPGASTPDRVVKVPLGKHCADGKTKCVEVVAEMTGAAGDDLLADGSFVYWIEGDTIQRRALDGTPCPEADCVVARDLPGLRRLAQDERAIYAGVSSDGLLHRGAVLRIPK